MEPVGRRMVEIAQETVASISAKDTYDRQQAGEPLVILDVRDPNETAEGHIEGAVLLPRGRLELRIEEVIPDKDTCIVAH